MGKDEPDISELVEKAKIVAEATGRDEQEVLADLLDDGIVNLSNEESKGKDLVTQLKEAAELITTVQSINKEVSENKVLNGGENSTEVKVETTLEGDIVDRAIESMQRKSENIKKLIITMTPLFLLATGGGLEALGIIDMMESEEDDHYDPSFAEIYGCTAPDAQNYMEEATMDDGSCTWSDNHGGGGGPPANCQWSWEDNSFMDNGNFLVIRATFGDDSCPHEMEGRFTVELIKDNEYYDEDEWDNIRFKHNYDLEHQFVDLEPGVYRNHFSFETDDGSNWNWDSPETHEVFDDTCYPQTELDEPTLTTEGNDLIVDLVFSDMGGCGQDIEIEMEVWNAGELHDNLDYGEVHFGVFWIEPEGDSTMRVQGKAQLSDLPDGDDWVVKVRYAHANADDAPYESGWRASNSVVIDEIDDNIYGCTDTEATNYDSMATSDDGSCEYPPEDPCDVEIHNHYRGHVANDAEQDAILIAFRVVPSNCEDEMVEIDIELFQNGYEANYTHWLEVNGDDEYTDVTHVFDGVAVGNSWTPKITASLDDEVLEQVFFWGIDVEEPEVCEINLYDIQIQTNSTHAMVGFDLDCGEETNNLDGYNVTVQFLVYHVNESNSGPNATGPLQWVTQTYYIQGYTDDVRYLVLDSFAVNNTTHYDFYWYAMWEVDGEQEFIERTWLNREVNP
tara:strand:- start:4405 stop:6432 length:2028 start_codon:yes stop_codon:yes gene_type:complete